MLKPFPKTNTGLEVQAILSPSHILIFNGNAWGIQNDASWETCFIVITIKLNCSGKYKEKINCQAREFWLLSANCHRFFEMHASLVQVGCFELYSDMQWRRGHLRWHNIQPSNFQDFFSRSLITELEIAVFSITHAYCIRGVNGQWYQYFCRMWGDCGSTRPSQEWGFCTEQKMQK